MKPTTEFSKAARQERHARRKCNDCADGIKCCECKDVKNLNNFSAAERKKETRAWRCLTCETRRCSICKIEKNKQLYHWAQWAADISSRRCLDCHRKRCFQCNILKTSKQFSASAWDYEDGHALLICDACTNGQETCGKWICANHPCRKRKPHSEFSKAIAQHGKRLQTRHKRCNECIERAEALIGKSIFHQFSNCWINFGLQTRTKMI